MANLNKKKKRTWHSHFYKLFKCPLSIALTLQQDILQPDISYLKIPNNNFLLIMGVLNFKMWKIVKKMLIEFIARKFNNFII